MARSCVTPGVGQILDTMIGLTRLTPLQRVIVAGSDNIALYLELRQRGFIRATTPKLCRHKRTQHAVGFIAGRIEGQDFAGQDFAGQDFAGQDFAGQDSGAGIEGGLEQISAFLTVNAGLALLVGSGENGRKIRTKLEALGFRIEAGVRCSQGLVLSASRQGYEQMARAA